MKKSNSRKTPSSSSLISKSSKTKSTPSPSTSVETKPMNFYSGVLPAHHSARMMGLCPFGLQLTANGEIESAIVRFKDRIWFVLVICIHMFLLFTTSRILKLSNDTASTILLYSNQCILVVVLAMASVSIVLDLINRHRLVETMQIFHEFDKEVRNTIYERNTET